MGIFGKRAPKTPAQNKAARAKGDKRRVADDKRARQIADRQQKKKRR